MSNATQNTNGKNTGNAPVAAPAQGSISTMSSPHNLALEAPKGQKALLSAAQKVVSAKASGDQDKLKAANQGFALAVTTNGAAALIEAEGRLKEASAWLKERGGSSLFEF